MKRFSLFVALLPLLLACERREETAPTMPPPTTQSSPQPAPSQPAPPPTASTEPVQPAPAPESAQPAPAPAPEPLEPAAEQTSGASGASGDYTVTEGDTLSAIAQEHDVNYQDLARWNNIRDPNRIYPGQTLQLTESGS